MRLGEYHEDRSQVVGNQPVFTFSTLMKQGKIGTF